MPCGKERGEPVDLLAGILRADILMKLQSMDVQREMVQKEMDQLEEIEVKRMTTTR